MHGLCFCGYTRVCVCVSVCVNTKFLSSMISNFADRHDQQDELQVHGVFVCVCVGVCLSSFSGLSLVKIGYISVVGVGVQVSLSGMRPC